MEEERIQKIIDKAIEKAKSNQSIKEELFAIKSIYDYINGEDHLKQLLPMVEEALKDFQNYQEKFEKEEEIKRNKKIKLTKEEEYKTLWGVKSRIYKMLHPSLNPENIKLSEMTEDDITELTNKLNNLKK